MLCSRGIAGSGRSRRRVAAVVVLGASLGLVACGGGSSGGDTSGADDLVDTETSEQVDKTLATAVEVATGQRGEKEDAPGALRFVNLIVRDGKGVDLDIWWGRPDEQVKAGSVAYGKATDYLTPKRAKGSDEAVFTITAAGTSEELMTWDRYSPETGDQTSAVFSVDDGDVLLRLLAEAPDELDSSTKEPLFPAASSGKVRLLWVVTGDGIDDPEGNLLSVTSGGPCLTNGTGIADADGNQAAGVGTFEVAAKASLYLALECPGSALSNTVTAPAGGRALLVASKGPDGKNALSLLPVKG